MSKSVLIIGSVFPEPTSSASGWRMLHLIDVFQEMEYTVHFASASKKNQHSHPLHKKQVQEYEIKLNCSSFDQLVETLQPQVVMFDRYMIEEQYSWRVAKVCPTAIRILDTEDLHFLRKARQEAYRKGIDFHESLMFSDLAKREVASILRCDLSLIISPVEYQILTDKFGISSELLSYLPFKLTPETSETSTPDYSARDHFCFIGNFLHDPNWQTVLTLKKIWPKIRRELPHTELHIFGAYTSDKVKQLEKPAEGFRIMGRADNAVSMLSLYRALLAPIPFGAGQKGKFIDASRAGTPSITNSMGVEGMAPPSEWPGFVTDSLDEFCDKAVLIYKNERVWEQANRSIQRILESFTDEQNARDFIQKIQRTATGLDAHRQLNFIGEILWSNQFMANKYRSQWIEEKNRRSD